MNLTELIEKNPNINLTITAGQLMEVLEYFLGKQEPKEDETFLTTEEAMKIANVSRPTLHRWKQAGIVPSIKFGKSVRYPKKEFLETLTRKSTK
jgi:excisionase family DNA binding protein